MISDKPAITSNTSIDLVSPVKFKNRVLKTAKKISLLFWAAGLMVLLFSCSTPADVKTLDLDKVTNDFKASAFYQAKIEQTNQTVKTDPAKMSKKELKEKLDMSLFAKDTLCFYNPNEIDGKNEYIRRGKPNDGLFGFAYKTIAWDNNDSLAVLNGVYFQKLDMLEQKDGKLISLKAMNESVSDAAYRKLLAHLKKKYGAATVLSQNKAENLEVLDWETADNSIQLRTKVDTVENVLSIENGVKKDVKMETKYTIDYFRVTKKYSKDLDKIRTGEWFLAKDN